MLGILKDAKDCDQLEQPPTPKGEYIRSSLDFCTLFSKYL